MSYDGYSMDRDHFPEVPKINAYQPTEIRARHEEILRRYAIGEKEVDIAEALGITTRSVNHIVNSELGQERVQEIKDLAEVDTVSVINEIKLCLPQAVKILKSIMLGKVEQTADHNVPIITRLKAAESLLDRGDVGKTTRSHSIVNHGYMGKVGLEIIRERAKSLDCVQDIMNLEPTKVEEIPVYDSES